MKTEQSTTVEAEPKKSVASNPFGKTVKPYQAHAVYSGGGWTWFILKMYQAPEKAVGDPFARALTFVKSPYVPEGEYGDTYLKDIGGSLVSGPDIRGGKRA